MEMNWFKEAVLAHRKILEEMKDEFWGTLLWEGKVVLFCQNLTWDERLKQLLEESGLTVLAVAYNKAGYGWAAVIDDNRQKEVMYALLDSLVLKAFPPSS